MPPQKEPLQCIPALLIKEQVKQNASDIRLESPDIWADTWNRYPCERDDPNKCSNDHCIGNVSFIVTKNNFKQVKILRLYFYREDRKAYVEYNQQLRGLFQDGLLSPVPLITINLIPPFAADNLLQITCYR